LILYVNGDSHSAGAEAMNSFAFANDDPLYYALGRQPHPDNERVSYGCLLANDLYAVLYCDAESASSNDRIIRTTKEYLKDNTPDAIVIGWSTWEREEWLENDTYWQINAGGIGSDWPDTIKHRYHDWITGLDHKKKEQEAHDKIWAFHQELSDIPHLFFNSYLALDFTEHRDWGNNYLYPYDDAYTYYHWLSNQGYHTVNPKSYHYGPDAHRAWAEFLVLHLTKLI
jgi:hypothetical protein